MKSHTIRLYGRFVLLHLKSQMQYKASFALTVAGQFLTSFSAFLAIYFLFARFHEVDGFSYPEVLLCFAVVLLSFSLAECFIRGFDTFSRMLGNGEFDRILVRPRGTVFQVLASKLELSRIGRLLQAAVVLVYALPRAGVDWTAGRAAALFLMLVSCFCVFAGLFLLHAALCFFTTEGLEVTNILTDGGREFGAYPLAVYGRGVLSFFTYVVPLALCQYYPLLYLLGHTEESWYLLLPLAGPLFLLPCYGVWRLGVRHFRSTGS